MGDALDPETRDFLLQEIKFVGERTAWYLAQQQIIENLGLLASGGVWAFLLTRPVAPAPLVAWLPFLITSILGIKSYLFDGTILLMYDYVFEVEARICQQSDGWLHYFRTHAKRNGVYKRQWRTAFWIALVLLNLSAAVSLDVGLIVSR